MVSPQMSAQILLLSKCCTIECQVLRSRRCVSPSIELWGCESLHLLMFAPRESAVSDTLLQLCSVPQVTRGDDNSPSCPQPPIHSKQRQCLQGGKLGRRTDDEPGVDNVTVTYKCLQMSASRFVRLRKEVFW